MKTPRCVYFSCMFIWEKSSYELKNNIFERVIHKIERNSEEKAVRPDVSGLIILTNTRFRGQIL